jgi:hypothetical protein
MSLRAASRSLREMFDDIDTTVLEDTINNIWRILVD